MHVFLEVVEYSYTSIVKSLDIFVCVYNIVRLLLLWNTCVYSFQLQYVFKTRSIILVVVVTVNIR